MNEDTKEVMQACVDILITATLDLIQEDPHQWSDRPCPTCRAVSSLIGKPFGCYLKIANRRKAHTEADSNDSK